MGCDGVVMGLWWGCDGCCDGVAMGSLGVAMVLLGVDMELLWSCYGVAKVLLGCC